MLEWFWCYSLKILTTYGCKFQKSVAYINKSWIDSGYCYVTSELKIDNLALNLTRNLILNLTQI